MRYLLFSMLLASTTFSTANTYADVSSIIQNVQGVESDVKGSVSDVNKRVLDVFKKEGIQSTGVDTEDSGAKQIVKGKKDKMDIQVQLTPAASGQTHVSVTAKTGLMTADKDYAQSILSKLVQVS